jgi:hypothetical protein
MRRVFKQAFERDLWLGALAAAPDWPGEASPQALSRQLRRAWDAGDVAAVVALGRRLAKADALSPVERLRLGRGLVRLRLFEEALAVAEAASEAPETEGLRLQAIALAGAGRREDAAAALAEARRGGAEADELDRLEQALGAPGDPDGVEQALSLGLDAIAVEGLEAALAAPPADEAALVRLLDLARSASRLANPAEGARLLQALAPLYGAAEERAAFDSVRRLLAGEGDDQALLWAPPDQPVRHRLGYLLAAACAAQAAWPAAIFRFGHAVARLPRQDEHFHELARCVEADIRAAGPIRAAPPAERRRFVDVSPFNGEFTLLEIKLNEMADWVDAFVIYESRATYTGRPKPLHFAEGRERFAAFADKIVHVVLDETPPYAGEAWARELCQRGAIARALAGLVGPDDVVMMSDTDEVLDHRVVQAWDGLYDCLGLRTFCWFLNLRLLEPVKQGAKSCLIKGRFALGAGTAATRLGLGALAGGIIPEAGWHFTSVLTPEDLKIKLDSYSHEDWAGSTVAEQEAFLRAIRAGRAMPGYERQPIDASFPRWLREHRDSLAQFIL